MRRHVKPEQETAGGPVIAVTAAENLIGEIELQRIEPAVFLDMGLVRIGSDRDPLRRQRHLRGGDVAQLQKRAEEVAVASHEAYAQAGQVRARSTVVAEYRFPNNIRR